MLYMLGNHQNIASQKIKLDAVQVKDILIWMISPQILQSDVMDQYNNIRATS